MRMVPSTQISYFWTTCGLFKRSIKLFILWFRLSTRTQGSRRSVESQHWVWVWTDGLPQGERCSDGGTVEHNWRNEVQSLRSERRSAGDVEWTHWRAAIRGVPRRTERDAPITSRQLHHCWGRYVLLIQITSIFKNEFKCFKLLGFCRI